MVRAGARQGSVLRLREIQFYNRCQRGRRVRRLARPFRLRQEHGAQSDLRSVAREPRRGARARHGHHRPEPLFGHSAASLYLLSLADRARQRRVRADAARSPKKERRDRAMEYLRKVDLADRCDAMPKQLSGGMQQRVAIARTLAMRLPIVLMDEPFGALDAQTRSDMQQMVLDLWDEEKNTIIFVTHDISEALLLG